MLGLPVWLKLSIVGYIGLTVLLTTVMGVDEPFWVAFRRSQILLAVFLIIVIFVLGLFGLYHIL